MPGLTNFSENRVKNALFGGAALNPPTTWYVAFLTASTDEEIPTLTEVSTTNWTNYARVAVANNATNFPAVGDDTPSSNAVTIDFGTATVPGAAVSVAGAALYDAASGGNCWAVKTFASSLQVANGNQVRIPAGQLTFGVN